MSDEEHDEESHEGGEGEEDSHEGGEGDNEDENKDDIGGGDDGSSDEEEAPPPKESFIQKWKNLITGKAQPATTYGPPYLKGMPQIDKTLIDECDMPEPSLKEVHAVLNEGVHPDVMDPGSYNDTAMIKLSRHCYTPESIKILEALKKAGAHVNKCNMMGITPLARACMARAPKGPPQKQRIKYIEWLMAEGCEKNCIDKGGFTPLYHAASNRDVTACKVLLEAGAMVRPNLRCKNPIEVAMANNHKALLVVLNRASMAEEIERKRQKLEKDKAQARAAEHRRQLELKMAENAESAGGLGQELKLDKLTLEESQAMVRMAYAKAQKDAAEATKRKDAERVRQAALLKAREEMMGKWAKVGKRQWRFEHGDSAEDQEAARTMDLSESLYEEITSGPKDTKLKLRWRDKTGLQRRDPLPPLNTLIPATIKPPQAPGGRGRLKESDAMGKFPKSEWLYLPGLKP